jgi:hypothetical protein
MPTLTRRCTAVRPASGCSAGSPKTVTMRFRHGPLPADELWQTWLGFGMGLGRGLGWGRGWVT